MNFKKIIAATLLATAALQLGACSQIDDNEIGLRRVYGELEDTPVKGLVWYNPWSTDIITFDNQQAKVKQEITTPTADQQRAHINSVAQVQLSKASAAKMYRNVGPDWVNSIVPPLIRSVQIGEFGNKTAIQTIQDQATIEAEIRAKLTERLAKRGIILADYQITKVNFSEEYMAAVEAKATATQNAEAEKNKTAGVKERAAQTVITAQAEADAMRVRANALESNPKLVEYEAVQKWNGELPQYMLGNSTPFINVK